MTVSLHVELPMIENGAKSPDQQMGTSGTIWRITLPYAGSAAWKISNAPVLWSVPVPHEHHTYVPA